MIILEVQFTQFTSETVIKTLNSHVTRPGVTARKKLTYNEPPYMEFMKSYFNNQQQSNIFLVWLKNTPKGLLQFRNNISVKEMLKSILHFYGTFLTLKVFWGK